ncbi:MAG: FAD-dependent oxidoreductase, partial [Candidatus Heimdallarchaeota archaeon]
MKVKINNEEKDFPEKTTIMDFLRQNNQHIAGVCKMKELDPYGSCRLCLVDINGRLLPACSTYPRESDQIATMNYPVLNSRKTALELMLSDHYGDCIGPCNEGCPSKSDVQNYLALIAMGKYHEAVALMKRDYILPASLGRVCPAFCEDACRRGLVEGPVGIRLAKRFAADYDLANGPWMPEIPSATGKSIGIVGGGPAGLAAAFYLRIKGHAVTIYEAQPKLGGMLRYGIPEYRLPKETLDKDIDTVIKTGIDVQTNIRVGEDISLEELRMKHHAIFVGVGAWKVYRPRLDNCEIPGVLDAIDFLRRIAAGETIDIGKDVLVVGGGNSAMDVARTCVRLGANVSLSYRRTEKEMPARKIEIEEAEEEGVNFMILSNPINIIGDSKVQEIEMVKMELGEPDESGRRRPTVCDGSNYCIEMDTIIFAIGQRPDFNLLKKIGIEHHNWGGAVYDPITYETNMSGVFVGGDVAIGAATVIEAIATSKDAAKMIDFYLKGTLPRMKEIIKEPWRHLNTIEADENIKEFLQSYNPYNHWKTVTEEDYKDRVRQEPLKADVLPVKERVRTFDEVELTPKEKDVLHETERCMSCGCLDTYECKLREYAKLYGAKQDNFAGELHKDPIDESHPHVILDNNKCILCGRCINLTHEITGEGLIDNLNRGFPTKNGPPIGMKLGEVGGDFVGQFVDECPTGAFTTRTPYPKDGPWRVSHKPTTCFDCGMGCEMNIEIYDGFAVNVVSKDDSWNHGLVCDKPRFGRSWEKAIEKPMKKDGSKFKELSVKDAKVLAKDHSSDLAIILTPSVTNDEAQAIMKFAKTKGFKVGALVDEGVSTAKFANIFTSKRIHLDVKLSDYPVLKPFVHIAQLQGAILTKENPDIAIINAPAKPLDIPTIIMHKGLNEIGLMNLGLEKIPKAKNYLVIGSTDKKLKGYIMSMGKNENAELILPLP